MRKQIILCFISSLSGGGAERQLIELIKILVEKGYDLSLLTYSDNDDYDCPKGIKRIKIKECNKVKLVIKIIKEIRNGHFDCCISYLQTNNLIACLSTFPFKNFKLICSERNLSQRVTSKERILFNLYRRADYIVPNSFAQRDFLSTIAPWLKKKLVAITNYTDIIKYQPSSIKLKPKGKTTIGVFARYINQKNPLFVGRLALQLKQMGLNYEFHWYGNYQPNRRDLSFISPLYLELKSFVEKNQLEDMFFLHGFGNNTVDLMNQVDIILQPSLYEGFPNTISEGLSCGKIIIASNVSDTPYIIEDGVNGFLFEPNDMTSAIAAFHRYSEMDEDERTLMEIANRKKAEVIFDREAFGKKYIQIIEH